MNGTSRTVVFDPIGITGQALENETILDVARRVSVPLGNSCGGTGICARCRVTVVDGAGQLSPATTIEARVAAQRNLDPAERLACQAVVLGPCVVTTPYW